MTILLQKAFGDIPYSVPKIAVYSRNDRERPDKEDLRDTYSRLRTKWGKAKSFPPEVRDEARIFNLSTVYSMLYEGPNQNFKVN